MIALVSFAPRPAPQAPTQPVGGTVAQRVSHHLAQLGSDLSPSNRAQPLVYHTPDKQEGAKWRDEDGREILNVAPEKFYPLWLASVPFAFSGFLSIVDPANGLSEADRAMLDDLLADLYWDTLEGMLLPAPVLTAITRASLGPQGGEFVSLLEAMRADVLHKEVDLKTAGHRRIAYRTDLLCNGISKEMSDRQLATAEAFVDLLLLQRAVMEDIVEAESDRAAGQLRSQFLEKVDSEEKSIFEFAIPMIVQPARISEAIPETAREAAFERVSARRPFDRTGVFFPEETAPQPVVAVTRRPGKVSMKQHTPAEPFDPPTPVPPTRPAAATPVGFVNEPLEWRDGDPLFHIPEWRALGCENMRPEEMSRHFLILGETGSGKTKSAIFPAVTAALRYPADQEGASDAKLAPSMLVIDPKREIAPHVERLNAQLGLDRLIIRIDSTGEQERIVHFFEGLHPLKLTPQEISQRMLSISEAYATSKAHRNDAFWTLQAEGIITQLVAVDLDLYARGGTDFLKAFWERVTALLKQAKIDLGEEPLAYTAANYVAVHSHLFNIAARGEDQRAVLGAYVKAAMEFGIAGAKTRQIAALGSLASETFTSVVATLNNVLSEISAESLAQHVSLNPFEGPPKDRCLSVMEVMNEGHCVCYYPRDTSTVANSIGKALKAKFFEFTFKREAQERPFFYVCDEFQRFITSDPMSGEQSFLDRCRAYRAVCVLATQSTASLKFALARDGSDEMDKSSLEILMNNTGNKLFFRNTDLDTQDRLRQLIPSPYVQGKQHLTEVRPVSTLEVGESYYLLSSGAWGRRRVRLAREEVER